MSSKRPENSGGKSSKPPKAPKPPKGQQPPMAQQPPKAPQASQSSQSPKPSMSKSSTGKAATGRTVPAQADIGEIARAVSTSFLILVFGSLLEPLATSVLPPAIGMFWRILYSLVAFALVGVRAGRSGPYPPLYGAGGALGSYALVVPLLFVQGTFDPLTMLYTIVFALVVGGAAGQIGARLRSSS